MYVSSKTHDNINKNNYTLTAKDPKQTDLRDLWGSGGFRVWGSRGSRATDFGSGSVHSGSLESVGLESVLLVVRMRMGMEMGMGTTKRYT